MKKLFKTLLVTAVLTIVFAMPAMAQEVTDPTTVYTVKSFNADEQILVNDFHKGEVWRCNNYLSYLDGVIYNLQETVRIKQEIVNNYKYLGQFNSYFNTLVPAAEADLAKAQAWVDAYKVYRVESELYLKSTYNF